MGHRQTLSKFYYNQSSICSGVIEEREAREGKLTPKTVLLYLAKVSVSLWSCYRNEWILPGKIAALVAVPRVAQRKLLHFFSFCVENFSFQGYFCYYFFSFSRKFILRSSWLLGCLKAQNENDL